MPAESRIITQAQNLDDWPATPDARYGQLASDNDWSGDNDFALGVKAAGVGLHILSDYSDHSYHFDENNSGVPTGWTEDTAAVLSRQTDLASHWLLRGASSNTYFRYYAIQSFDMASAPSTYVGWRFHFSLTNVDFTADLTYRFGFHATDGAGTVNDDIFLRVALQWDSSAEQWQVREERKDGTTQTDGTWLVLDNNPLILPMIIKARIRTGLDSVVTAIGHSFNEDAYLQLEGANTMAVTWNEPAVVIERSRGSGVVDKLYIDSVVYSDTA